MLVKETSHTLLPAYVDIEIKFIQRKGDMLETEEETTAKT